MTSGEFAVLTWPELANVIREVDGNHDLGAGELAERILRHPKVAAAAQPASGSNDADWQETAHRNAEEAFAQARLTNEARQQVAALREALRELLATDDLEHETCPGDCPFIAARALIEDKP